MARRVLGNVPVELIHRARRPVLVITPPAKGGSRMATEGPQELFATKPIDRLVKDTEKKETSSSARWARWI